MTDTTTPAETITVDLRDVRRALSNLRGGGMVSPPTAIKTGAALVEWLEVYGVKLALIFDSHADTDREYTKLRQQQSAMRAFLGTDQ